MSDRSSSIAKIGQFLSGREGWTVYGYDPGAGSWDPGGWRSESWIGLAARNGHVLVVDGGPNRYNRVADMPPYIKKRDYKLWEIHKDGKVVATGATCGLGKLSYTYREEGVVKIVLPYVSKWEAIIDGRAEEAGDAELVATGQIHNGTTWNLVRQVWKGRNSLKLTFSDKLPSDLHWDLKCSQLLRITKRPPWFWYGYDDAGNLEGKVLTFLERISSIVELEEESDLSLEPEPEAVVTQEPDAVEAKVQPTPDTYQNVPVWQRPKLRYQESRSIRAGGVPILNAEDGDVWELEYLKAVARGEKVCERELDYVSTTELVARGDGRWKANNITSELPMKYAKLVNLNIQLMDSGMMIEVDVDPDICPACWLKKCVCPKQPVSTEASSLEKVLSQAVASFPKSRYHWDPHIDSAETFGWIVDHPKVPLTYMVAVTMGEIETGWLWHSYQMVNDEARPLSSTDAGEIDVYTPPAKLVHHIEAWMDQEAEKMMKPQPEGWYVDCTSCTSFERAPNFQHTLSLLTGVRKTKGIVNISTFLGTCRETGVTFFSLKSGRCPVKDQQVG